MAGLLDYLMAKGAAPAPDTEMPSGLPVSGGAGSPLMDAFLQLQYDRLKDAVTAPRDAYSGDLQVYDPTTGHITDEAMSRAGGMAGLAMTGGIGGVARGGTAVGAGPIRAYHGSPHDFDKFSLSKIGTGEGAQVYGHGLYFAENEATAKAYREALSPMQLKGRDGSVLTVPDDLSPASHARDRLNASGGDYEKALASIRASQQSAEKLGDTGYIAVNRDAIPILNEWKDRGHSLAPGGRMYEVGIDADPAKMLNYDAGLAGQSKGVQDYGGHLLSKIQEQGLMRGQGLADIAGADIPYMTKRLGMNPAQVSSDLQGLGVPGVKYLDAGSRFSADKTHNYVTFSDDIVKILRKYGVASVAALPPAVRAVVESGRIPDDESASDAPQAINLGMRLSR